jgi:uncharacterized protein (UPF0147 family)
MKKEQVNEAIQALLEEGSTSKNLSESLQKIMSTLQSCDDICLSKNKCMCEMEQLVDNENLDPYLRTQLLDIVALMEQL